MSRLDREAPLLQELGRLRLQEIGEAGVERVGGLELADRGVDLDQEIAERRPFDALGRVGVDRIDPVGARLVAPGVGDRAGEIGAQVRPDRRRLVAVLAQPPVELGDRAGKSPQATVERVVGRLHVGGEEAEHEGGEGDENGDDEPHVVDRLAALLPLAEQPMQNHADRARPEEGGDDAEQDSVIRHAGNFAGRREVGKAATEFAAGAAGAIRGRGGCGAGGRRGSPRRRCSRRGRDSPRRSAR